VHQTSRFLRSLAEKRRCLFPRQSPTKNGIPHAEKNQNPIADGHA
jgi:hypothetical protein